MLKKTIFIYIIFFSSLIFGGAWTQGGIGHGFTRLGVFNLKSSKFFDENGDRQEFGLTLRQFAVSSYTNLGITKDIDLIIGGYYLDFEFGDVTDSRGIADINLGLKYKFFEGDVVLAAQLDFWIPTSSENKNLPEGTPIGTNSFDVGLRLIASKGFRINNFSGYLSVDNGFKNRTDNYSETVFGSGEIGISPFDWIGLNNIKKYTNKKNEETETETETESTKIPFAYLVFGYSYEVSLFNGGRGDKIQNQLLLVNNANYFAINPGIIINLTETASLDFKYQTIVTGRRTLADSDALNFGLLVKF